jgi:ParB-like chromosome segregation protein Spo0J
MASLTKKPAAGSGPSLTVVWRRVETLRPDSANPRVHSPKQVRQLARSIEAFGFNVPILVNRGLRVVAGHGRLLAARQLGLSEVPTILLDHLSEARTRAFMIADNRLAENAAWNDRLVLEQLREVSVAEPDFAIDATGFELGEIELETISAAPPRQRRPRSNIMPKRRQVQPAVAREGDWWLLGRHRVACGNLTDAAAELLSAEEYAVVVLTPDPAAADAVIRGWQARTGGTARHAPGDHNFADPGTGTMPETNPDADAEKSIQ